MISSVSPPPLADGFPSQMPLHGLQQTAAVKARGYHAQYHRTRDHKGFQDLDGRVDRPKLVGLCAEVTPRSINTSEHRNACQPIYGGLIPCAWLVLVLIAAGAGCVSHDSTTAERNASFAPYANAHIGQATVAEFLEQRTAPLIVLGDSGISSGYATAIDRRGYYLTTAHCVQHASVELMLGTQFIPAKVVWFGDPDKPGSDLAIIFVDSMPEEVFEWATEFGQGDVIFSIGLKYATQRFEGDIFTDPTKRLGTGIIESYLTEPTKRMNSETLGDFVAGKIFHLPSKPAVPLRASEFKHDAPGHPGDSGGPMVDANGRLIAINEAGFDFHIMGVGSIGLGRAYRPDLAWLGQIIDADSAMRIKEAKGDVSGAITAAERLIDLDPNNVAALNRRGQLEDRTGDPDAAIADYDRAIANDPANLNALYNRGNAEKGKHNFDQAIASFTAAIAIDPFDPNTLGNRGECYCSNGDFRAAIADETRALHLAPKGFRGTLAALDDMMKAVDLGVTNANYLVIRGIAWLALGDEQRAASDFESAVQLEPKNSQALFWRGAGRKIQGDLKGTLADWEDSIGADPANSNRTRLYRSLISAQGGQLDDGFAQEVVGWKDNSLKAMGQFVVGRTDEAALLAAVGKATDQPVLEAQCEAYYCIGVMHLVRGDVAGAREFFQKSVTTGQMSRLALIFAQAELTRLAPSAVPPAPSSP